MKTKITTLSFVLFIITLFSCNKSNNITISIIDGFYSVLDEYGHSHWGDSSFTFDCTIRIYPLEYVTFDNYTYYDNRYEFNDVKLDTNLYYDIIFEGSNHQNFIINDYLFKPIITKKLIWAYLPQIIITEKSKAVITDFSIDSLRFITSPYMYTKGVFTVSGKVSKEENKPFRSFVIYLGDENVSSTNYDLKFNPKLSQENFNYFDDGSFIFTDTIRFGMSQNLHYLDCFYESEYVYAVAYGKAGLDVYDSIVPYYDENYYGSMYGSYYDVYYDPNIQEMIDPGLGEPSNKSEFYFGTVPDNFKKNN